MVATFFPGVHRSNRKGGQKIRWSKNAVTVLLRFLGRPDFLTNQSFGPPPMRGGDHIRRPICKIFVPHHLPASRSHQRPSGRSRKREGRMIRGRTMEASRLCVPASFPALHSRLFSAPRMNHPVPSGTNEKRPPAHCRGPFWKATPLGLEPRMTEPK